MTVDVALFVFFINFIFTLTAEVAPFSLALSAGHVCASIIFSSFKITFWTGLLLPILDHIFKFELQFFELPALKVHFMLLCQFVFLFIFFVIIV